MNTAIVTTEEWKLIENIPMPAGKFYEVSSMGRVRSVIQPSGQTKNLKQFTTSKGYKMVGLGVGKRKTCRVHRLVCTAFNGPAPLEDSVVRHLNGTPSDNRPSNLAWGTHADNMADMIAHGRTLKGERNHNSKLSIEDVQMIRKLFAEKVKRSEIASRFGLKVRNVYHIVNCESWAHITSASHSRAVAAMAV